jgi:hypothetical protein
MAQALGWGNELVADLRQRGKGYSARQASPRSLPSEKEIETFIDQLPPVWQWPVGVVATYGCRPHEALLLSRIRVRRNCDAHDHVGLDENQRH